MTNTGIMKNIKSNTICQFDGGFKSTPLIVPQPPPPPPPPLGVITEISTRAKEDAPSSSVAVNVTV